MSKDSLKRAVIIWAGLRLMSVIDKLLMRFSMIEDREIHSNTLFPWILELEGNWSVIRTEADRVLADRRTIPPVREISPDHEMIAVDDRWRSLILWGYGLRWERNCRRCPETARLLEGIPGLLTAFYSVLEPGAHIPRHTGPTKAILTAHLGLRIPSDREACHIQVGSQGFAWQEGKMVVFDDMYPHEVWNDSEEDRVVLLLHLKRPERFPGSIVRDGLFAALRHSPFVQDGLKNLERWDNDSR